MLAPKWVLLMAVNAAALLVMSGCTSAHDQKEKYYLVATNIKIPYWQSALAGLNHGATEMNVKAELAGPDTYDPNAEKQELQRIIGLQPTGILVSAGDAAVMAPAIDAALNAGIPVITMDSDSPSSKRLLFIGTDHYKAGTLGAQTVIKLLNGKGNVVIFTMKGQTNLDQRLHGYQDGFDAHPGIKIAQVIDMKGDPGMAFDGAKNLLDSKAKVDAFVCLEAIACPEVAEVVNRAQMNGKVTIVAMDTDQRTLDWILKGVISATIGQKPYTMGYYGIKLVDDLHHHKPNPLVSDWAQNSFSPVPEFVDTGVSLIDKSNVGSFETQRASSSQAQ